MKTRGLLAVALAFVGVGLWVGAGCETGDSDGLSVTPSNWTFTNGSGAVYSYSSGGSITNFSSGASTNASTEYKVSGLMSAVELKVTVKGALALPLEWRVSNPALGDIARPTSGDSAVYRANTDYKTNGNYVAPTDYQTNDMGWVRIRGDNTVTVKDQYGNEGSAVMSHR